jgi:exodeoxyribonuclease X
VNRIVWPERLLVVDVEGNGQEPPDLLELAVVPVVDGRVQAQSVQQSLFRPPRPITHFATGVHHITNQAVESAVAFADVADAVRADLEGAWIAAHNAHVDYGVLTRHLPGWQPAGVLDTLRLARHALPQAGKYNLDALLVSQRIDTSTIPGQRHRAAFDATATALLLLHLAQSYDSWDDLIRAAVPPKLPGGPAPDFEEEKLF